MPISSRAMSLAKHIRPTGTVLTVTIECSPGLKSADVPGLRCGKECAASVASIWTFKDSGCLYDSSVALSEPCSTRGPVTVKAFSRGPGGFHCMPPHLHRPIDRADTPILVQNPSLSSPLCLRCLMIVGQDTFDRHWKGCPWGICGLLGLPDGEIKRNRR